MGSIGISELEKALKCRAKKGCLAPGAQLLGELELVRLQQQSEPDGDLQRSIDRVLWNAVEAVATDAFQRADGGFRRTSLAVRCFLAIYSRLDLANMSGADGDLARESLFPDSPSGGFGTPDERYEKILQFDKFGPYPKEAMCAALSCAGKGAIERHSTAAPRAIADVLHAHEAAVLERTTPNATRGPRSATASMADRLLTAEDQLRGSGLLSSYCETLLVKDKFIGLMQKLKEPLTGYANAGANFTFVVEQLDAVTQILQGICVSEDLEVNGNDTYVKRQFDALRRGIHIERIFLYTEADKRKIVQAVEIQKAAASTATLRASADGDDAGVYRAYLLERSKALELDAVEEYLSIAIIDRKLPTQRVVRQRFGPEGHLTYREVTVSSEEVDRAVYHFDTLKENSKSV
jgi:hypothetical protein